MHLHILICRILFILQKISKRLHLSKVKHSKFNESGQLVVFHLSSVVWCFYVVVTVSGPGDRGSMGPRLLAVHLFSDG